MVDNQSPTTEIRRGKKKEKKKPQDENIMSASAKQGGHSNAETYYVIREQNRKAHRTL